MVFEQFDPLIYSWSYIQEINVIKLKINEMKTYDILIDSVDQRGKGQYWLSTLKPKKGMKISYWMVWNFETWDYELKQRTFTVLLYVNQIKWKCGHWMTFFNYPSLTFMSLSLSSHEPTPTNIVQFRLLVTYVYDHTNYWLIF